MVKQSRSFNSPVGTRQPSLLVIITSNKFRTQTRHLYAVTACPLVVTSTRHREVRNTISIQQSKVLQHRAGMKSAAYLRKLHTRNHFSEVLYSHVQELFETIIVWTYHKMAKQPTHYWLFLSTSNCNESLLPHKVKTQYVHCMINCKLLPFPLEKSCRNMQTNNSLS